MTAGDAGPALVVVANRLPVRRTTDRHRQSWEPSPGGLVAALAPVLADRQSTWVGWSGDAGVTEPFAQGGISFVPVPMADDEIEDFYEGFSNRTLWPLYHDAIRPPEYRATWWSTYADINARFARIIAESAPTGATVWVHDYQLQLVPKLLRQLRPDLRIGFFLHISFPPQELFMQLPWRTELIEGMLGADVVGFQVPVAARNFCVLARRLTGAGGRGSELVVGDRIVHTGAFPVSIDVERYASIARRPDTQERARAIRAQLGNPETLILGVDRLDYTKGISARLGAYKEMLFDGTLAVPERVMVQIAVPTRDNVPEYHEQRQQVEQLVGEINGDFGRMGTPAVHYLHQNLPLEELVALYCAADVLVVTPYRDGMNLVVKEYIACRLDDSGAVVLSEFAGAAQEMPAAHLVNPHDQQSIKEAILTAVVAPPQETHRRMRALRRGIHAWTGEEWARSFLHELTVIDERHRGLPRRHASTSPSESSGRPSLSGT
jgi:trehalose 6-phosphate synthase